MTIGGGWLRCRLAIAAVFWAGATIAADAPKLGPAPGWVKPLAMVKLAPLGSDATAAAKLLLLDTQYRFTPGGTFVYVEQVTRAQTPRGLTALGTLSLPWKPGTQTLTVHKLNIIRGDQVIDALAGRPFTVLRRETNLEAAVLDGVLTATVQIEGLQVGDAIDLAATYASSDPVVGRHAEAHFNWPGGYAADRLRVRALWARPEEVHWREGDQLDAPKLTTSGGDTEFDLDMANVDALHPPNEAPPRFSHTREIDFSDFGSWAELSALFAPLYEKASHLSASSPLKAEIAKIRAASPDQNVQAAMALSLVEDQVRYVFLGMNDGALTPADADTTWSRRFGDCKGKTALLIALLRGLGVEAQPALVSTTLGDGLDARPPSVQLFDHVIVRAVIAGKTYWLDGARVGDRGLGLLRVPAYHWALPIQPSGATLIPLTVVASDEPDLVNLLKIDASVGITVPAPVHGEVHLRGDAAMVLHLQLANATPSDLDRFLRNYWTKQYDFIEPKTVSARFDEALGEESLVMDGSAKMAWGPPPDGGPARYEADNARLGWKSDFKRDPGPHADAPVEIAFPDFEKSVETIVLPVGRPGFTIQGEDIDKTLAGWAFHRTARIDQGVFSMEATRRSLAAEIPVADNLTAIKPLQDLSERSLYLQEPRNYVETDAELVVARQSNPDDAVGFSTRAWAFLKAGDYAKAAADYDRAIALGGKWGRLYANRAQVRWETCQYDQVKADVDMALSLDPHDERALDLAASLAIRQGKYREAVDFFTKALEQQGAVAWTLRRRSMVYINLGEYAKSLTDLNEAARLEPNPKGDEALRAVISHLKSTGRKPEVHTVERCAEPRTAGSPR